VSPFPSSSSSLSNISGCGASVSPFISLTTQLAGVFVFQYLLANSSSHTTFGGVYYRKRVEIFLTLQRVSIKPSLFASNVFVSMNGPEIPG
jgi:hypothetical protein